MRGGHWLRSSLLALGFGVVALAPASQAFAQPAAPRLADLKPRLAAASDPRVRAATVLQLGATNDDEAVAPLCTELSNGAEIVRVSAASALRRLNRTSSLGCLKARLSVETADGPKLQLTRAIQGIEAGGGGPAGGGSAPPAGGGGTFDAPQHPNAKYYVALSQVSNAADRPTPEVEAVVLKAVRAKLEGSDFQLAPMREAPDAAKKALSSRKAKGFYLSISVEKFDYSGGSLRVKVNIAIFSYPGKSLIAPSGKSASMSGVSPGSRGAEDQLLEAVAGAAAKQFADNVGSM